MLAWTHVLMLQQVGSSAEPIGSSPQAGMAVAVVVIVVLTTSVVLT